MDLDRITLVAGVGDGKKTASMLSLRALLDGRPYGDEHPSKVLLTVASALTYGPWWSWNAERTAALLPLVRDERFSAAHCDASPEAEHKRAEICAHWALSVAAPMALDALAYRLRQRCLKRAAALTDCATLLRVAPTIENADAALNAAGVAVDAALKVLDTMDTFEVALARGGARIARRAALDAVESERVARIVVLAIDAARNGDARTAARQAAFAGANIRPELIALFDRLLDVRGVTP